MTGLLARGVLAVMGSGETSPTMVGAHRRLMEEAGGEAVVLDTSYAFQENASEISARAADYFSTNVSRPVSIVELGVAGAPEEERALERLRRASYLFAGPGSPSYALRRWRSTPVPSILADRLQAGATLVFASAAALTLGRWTIPVYEIYKAGFDPGWLNGIDLLAAAGLEGVAVVPHFDNSEGGHHDTRFCYLGESRLRVMEQQLEDKATILGVDEHTVCTIDFERGVLSARGRGGVTLRRAGADLATLVDAEVGLAEFFSTRQPAPARSAAPPRAAEEGQEDTPFLERVGCLEREFEAAMRGSNFDGAVRAVLALEAEIVAWAADTLQSDEVDRARAVLRRLIQRLAEAGELAGRTSTDSGRRVEQLVEAMVGLRAAAREDADFVAADRIRDLLAESGIEVRDTPEGQEWSKGELQTPEAPSREASPAGGGGRAPE
jgi:hypothetical protein